MSSKDKLGKDVADPEQRHLLVAAQIRNGLPVQIRATREDRRWTQAALAEKLGTTQNTISRLENPKTSKPTITTLKRIAEAFDVALLVKFAPFSEFVDSLGGMSWKSVAVPNYEAEKQQEQANREQEEATTVHLSNWLAILNPGESPSGCNAWRQLAQQMLSFTTTQSANGMTLRETMRVSAVPAAGTCPVGIRNAPSRVSGAGTDLGLNPPARVDRPHHKKRVQCITDKSHATRGKFRRRSYQQAMQLGA
jgi:transcriptional regulator with XRE-family HTH domain